MRQIARYLAIGAALAALFVGGEAFAQAPAQQFQQGLPGSGNAGYPPGSTPTGSVASGANTGGFGVSITPGATTYAYLCGAQVNGLGATGATTVTPTITGAAGGTLTYQGQYTFPAGAAVVTTPFERTFTPCLRGSAPGIAVTFNVPGAAGNTATNSQIWGYVE